MPVTTIHIPPGGFIDVTVWLEQVTFYNYTYTEGR